MKNRKTSTSNIILAVIIIVPLFSLIFRGMLVNVQAGELGEEDAEIAIVQEDEARTADAADETPPSLAPSEKTIINTSNMKELKNLIEECRSTMNSAHAMAESARELGYEEDHPVVLLAIQEYEQAHGILLTYQRMYEKENAKWDAKRNEYPTATTIWLYLKELGYNDYVVAGIMGNIMNEAGGNSLSINASAYSSQGYYGICQWSSGYRNSIWWTDLQTQCEFLASTIRYEFDHYGSRYQRGFNYSSFISLTNEREAALAFARCYERCSCVSYGTRRANATVAYNYFVN